MAEQGSDRCASSLSVMWPFQPKGMTLAKGQIQFPTSLDDFFISSCYEFKGHLKCQFSQIQLYHNNPSYLKQQQWDATIYTSAVHKYRYKLLWLKSFIIGPLYTSGMFYCILFNQELEVTLQRFLRTNTQYTRASHKLNCSTIYASVVEIIAIDSKLIGRYFNHFSCRNIYSFSIVRICCFPFLISLS